MLQWQEQCLKLEGVPALCRLVAYQAHPREFEEVVGMDIFHHTAEELAGATDCQGTLAGWVHLKGRRATSFFLVGPGNIECPLNHRQKMVAPSLVCFQLGSNKDYSKGREVVFVGHLQVASVEQQQCRSECRKRAPGSSYAYSNNRDRHSSKSMDRSRVAQ